MNKLHIPGRLWRRGSAELTEVRRRVNFGLILLLVSILSPGGGWAQTINWTKYDNTVPAISDGASTNGKIPLGNSGRGDNVHIAVPLVIKDGATYKMWCEGDDVSASRIYYATSSNGLEWTKYDNTIPAISDGTSTNGKIPLGNTGKGDDAYLSSPSVIKDGATDYKMWYTGHDGVNYRIYYATSSNGLDWTKYDNTIPVPSDGASTNGKIPLGTDGKGDDVHTSFSSVIKDGATYKMWYTGYDGVNYRIYYATSSNGLEWTKYDNTIPAISDGTSTNGKIPLGNSGRGDNARTFSPSVIKDGATDYKMWYMGLDGTNWRIYYATSSNGLEWTKYDNTIPPASDTTNSNSRVGLGTSGKGDDVHVGYSSVIKEVSTSTYYKMWYSGYDGANWRIYYATFQIPPPVGTIFTFK